MEIHYTNQYEKYCNGSISWATVRKIIFDSDGCDNRQNRRQIVIWFNRSERSHLFISRYCECCGAENKYVNVDFGTTQHA